MFTLKNKCICYAFKDVKTKVNFKSYTSLTGDFRAWASSAPVTYFRDGGVPVGGFDNVVKNTFIASGCVEETVIAAFWALDKLGEDEAGLEQLTEIFQIDPRTPLNTSADIDSLSLYIQTGMEYMAMTNYPYPTNFLEDMPGWPVQEACKKFSNLSSTSLLVDLVTALKDAANVYYNYTGTLETTCFDSNRCNDQSLGALSGEHDGWDFQECTEIIIEMCSLGLPNDFFKSDCNATSFIDFQNNLCTGIYGSSGWTKDYMNIDGVKKLYGWDFSQASNIIFT